MSKTAISSFSLGDLFSIAVYPCDESAAQLSAKGKVVAVRLYLAPRFTSETTHHISNKSGIKGLHKR
jgi:hypothetical protein